MIEFKQISKQYGPRLFALRDINLTVNKGDLIFLTGPSGAGKTTLLNLISAIERPSSGILLIGDTNIGQLSSSGLPYLRRNLGLVLRQKKIIHDRTILTNVMLPAIIMGATQTEAKKRASIALHKVGLLHQSNAIAHTLSAEEQQRTLIARAIVNTPPIILADEPTAGLDHDNACKVLEILKSLHANGVTCVISSQNTSLLKNANRTICLTQGQINTDAKSFITVDKMT